MRIVIADDHGIVRDGIRWMLVNEPSIEVVGEAADGEALLRLLAETEADVVLLDIRMPGLSGLGALEAIRDRHPDLPVLVLSMYDEPELVVGVVARGANGYILKGARREELIRAIGVVASGGSYLQDELTTPLVHRVAEGRLGEAPPDLTPDERHILKLVARGRGNREIAAELGMSEPAVRGLLYRIYGELHARGRSEAVAIALRLGLID